MNYFLALFLIYLLARALWSAAPDGTAMDLIVAQQRRDACRKANRWRQAKGRRLVAYKCLKGQSLT